MTARNSNHGPITLTPKGAGQPITGTITAPLPLDPITHPITAITAEGKHAGQRQSRGQSRQSRSLAITPTTLFRGGGVCWRGLVGRCEERRNRGRTLPRARLLRVREMMRATPCGSEPVAPTVRSTSFALVRPLRAVHVHTTARRMALRSPA